MNLTRTCACGAVFIARAANAKRCADCARRREGKKTTRQYRFDHHAVNVRIAMKAKAEGARPDVTLEQLIAELDNEDRHVGPETWIV